MADFETLNRIRIETHNAMMAAGLEAQRLAERCGLSTTTEEDADAYERQRKIMHTRTEEHERAVQAMRNAGFLKD